MTKINEIKQLKHLAKRHAHANRLPKHEALDAIAQQLDFPHWAKLATKAQQGWLPGSGGLAKVEAFVSQFHVTLEEGVDCAETSVIRSFDAPIKQGAVDGHEFQVFEALGDIQMEGDGWRILIAEGEFSQPIVEIEETHKDTSPPNDLDFIEAAIAIASDAASKIRAGIASDWPRRSTKPDKEGTVVHPLFRDRSAEWYCLHCDGKITGAQIAASLWHCPACGASPIDIFAAPFWLEGSDIKPKPVESLSKAQKLEPKIKIVDSRPTLDLDEKSISTFLRIALFEDAANPGERLGAMQAEIYVHEDGDADILFDEDLWPEDKDPIAAYAVAEELGIELELSVTSMTFPFAWPGLGHATPSTREYVRMLLDAYAEHGVARCKMKKDD